MLFCLKQRRVIGISPGIKENQIHIGYECGQLWENYKDTRIPRVFASYFLYLFLEMLLSWTGLSAVMISRHSSKRMWIYLKAQSVFLKECHNFLSVFCVGVLLTVNVVHQRQWEENPDVSLTFSSRLRRLHIA